jgi:guanylate kinase
VKKELGRKGKLFVISGPSGSGKSTLVQRALGDKGLKKILARSVSFTTRPLRSGERNGKDYFFISASDFKEKLRAKKILEWTRYLGYYYGTPMDFIEEQLRRGRSIALCLDFKGAVRVKRLFPRETVTVFVMPGSLEDLPQRIQKRCAKTKQEEIRRRLALAKKEVKNSSRYDFVVINKELKHAVRELVGIIKKATQH